MTLAPWLSPVTMRLLALVLLHFLWQGAALAALAYVVTALCRSASARYAVAVGTMVLMFAAPVATFMVFRAGQQASTPTVSAGTALSGSSPVSGVVHLSATHSSLPQDSAPAYFPWLVELWFSGVALLGLRSAGGFLLVERLRRKECIPVNEELLQVCVSLQRRLGVTRVVRYCESLRLDAPAVAGWIRPVVLLPVSALTGLTPAQLEAVIAHELAHIQRLDAFVNLFQVAVETLLFYHPAVWWIGKRARTEREHCCDDAAVAVCGSPVTYAHALTRLAEGEVAPQLVMAANRSPLAERIGRLLGANSAAESFRGANLSAGVLCLSAALLAGSALLGSVHNVHAQTPAPALAPTPPPALAAPPAWHAHVPKVPEPAPVARLSAPAPVPAPSPAPAPRQEDSASPALAPQAAPSAGNQSYIDSLKEAGLTNLTVDELVSLKVQGVTGDYVKSLVNLGLKLDVNELIGIKVQGITSEYVKEIRVATGQSLGVNELIGLKVQGVTPEYIKQMHDLGLKTDADDVIGMKVQGITPEYVKEMRALGLKLDSDEIIGMKVQGVTPEYVREMQGLGLKLDTDAIIGMKVQGVTPEYVKGIRDLGLNSDADEIIGMKVQGITPDYLKELQAAGFKVDVDEAIAAKVQGITPEFIAKARSHGFKDLTLDKLIRLKMTGVLDAEK
jgi:beta-lactamase regulating signal transducer with metallopeptidase domain